MKHDISSAAARGNNLDLLRLLAASSVIFSHSFGLVASGGHAAGDPLFILTGGQMTFGELGVYIFFVISGFLITGSLEKSSTLQAYVVKRALRILPGLLFVLLSSVIVLGPLLTVLPLADYFLDRNTWSYLFNIVMFWSQPGLPGVLADNPLPTMVNGSLWTLKFEVFCYCLIAGIGTVRLLRLPAVAILALFCVLAAKFYTGPGYGYVFYSSFFLAGSVLYLARDTVTIDARWFACAVMLVLLGALVGSLQAAFAVGGSYAVIYLAYCSNSENLMRTLGGDYSYGLYLFGFPVQQTVLAWAGGEMAWWQNLVIAYPIAFCIAVISWKFCERPALVLRERLRRNASRPAMST